ncbi:MAG: PLP-dependent aminotransferase family protein [Bacillota bacterium]
MKIEINRKDKTPVYIQIAGQIKNMLHTGEITDGYVLPSERVMAAELGVHRNTVTKAYGELKSEGLLDSSRGSCYRVSFRGGQASGEAEGGENEPDRRKTVSWEAVMKREYDDFNPDFDDLYSQSFNPGFISFAGGVAAREPYPPEEIADVFEELVKSSGDKAYFYVPYQGDPELIKQIVKYMASIGIRTRSSNVQIFSENNQALDFIMQLMLSPGDGVIIDEIMASDVYRTIELAGGKLITVPADEEGMICDNLDKVIETSRPKFIYVDSSFNNPTGITLSLERRRKLLELSYRYRIPIIEDDESSEIYYGERSLPSIKSMDHGDNVIYMYSFSLDMVPGIGVSFVVADRKIIRQFSNMVSLRVVNPDWAGQMVMLQYMKSGLFAERLTDFRSICKSKRDLMCSRLAGLAGRYGLEYNVPEGGVYIWVRLPEGMNSRKLLRQAQKRGLTFMPGYVFFPKKNMGARYLRLNFSYPTEDEIERGMDILEDCLCDWHTNK